MTALEQKLLDELEPLEKERLKEAERLQSLAENYKRNIEEVSRNLIVEYQETLTKLIEDGTSEEGSLIAYLKTLTEQNSQIIKLLEKPPKAEDAVEKLMPVLSEFFNTLEANLASSNKKLTELTNRSLQDLES